MLIKAILLRFFLLTKLVLSIQITFLKRDFLEAVSYDLVDSRWTNIYHWQPSTETMKHWNNQDYVKHGDNDFMVLVTILTIIIINIIKNIFD